MFRAELSQWEFWDKGRWPVRPDGVPYPKNEALVIEKTKPPVPYRQAWRVDAVLERLRKAKLPAKVTYETRWIKGDYVWNEGAPYTQLGERVVYAIITATPSIKKRRKKYVKPYNHPHDGMAHNPCNGHVLPCDCWGCHRHG